MLTNTRPLFERWTIRFPVMLALAALFLGMAAVAPEARAASESRSSQQQAKGKPEPRDRDVPLASGALRRAVKDVQQGKKSSEVDDVGGRLRVEVLHSLSAQGIREAIEKHGGSIEQEVDGILVQALIPPGQLTKLEQTAGIDVIRPPLQAAEPADEQSTQSDATAVSTGSMTGEEIAKTKASAWHAAGITGAGVKVGIVDGFDGGAWNAAYASGDVPAASGTFCRTNGVACDVWSGESIHGVAVAEIIHEMAPDAKLYLATVSSPGDLQAAVDYFAGQGVRIISRSETAQYDGPGDGTGAIARVLDNAVSRGMAWFNAAGNSGGKIGSWEGSYWRGNWSDPDGDGWLDFAPGDELMEFGCSFINGLRWSDWGSSRTDYNVYIYDTEFSFEPESWSEDNQPGGAQPLELIEPNCTQRGEPDYLAIYLYAPGAGTSGDVLEFMVNGDGVEYWKNPGSATGPMADTKSPGGLAVGAVAPAGGTEIAPYSSQGPTNDGRIKPDLSAASCVSSYVYSTYENRCFGGTSAATPVVSGAAALILQSGAASTPAELKTYLLTRAVADRGAVGADNVFGAGELQLPAPADKTPPVMTSVSQRVTPNSKLGATAIPVTVSWSGTDNGGSGITEYVVYRTADGRASWTRVWPASPKATSVALMLEPSTTYEFAVKAVDAAGNVGEYRYGGAFSLGNAGSLSETNTNIAYTGTWTRLYTESAYGGALKYSTATGAKAKLTFTGRSIAWVTSNGSTLGKAKVYIDGVLKATIDLSGTATHRLVEYTTAWSTAATHTITIEVLGTSGRPRVDVDAFVVLT